ncbi:RNA 2',3'-cyclic phosphodiesterase [Candidatus Parcubacteria bacterium]|nr:MAG: RNA 2',3'-cyclic phosphodiesterase [Candidatus Parcubacteria bacterium]
MERRVFIAINLPEEVLDAIEDSLRRFEDRGGVRLREEFRFVPKENWHITLSFLGGQAEDAIVKIIAAMQEIASLFRLEPLSFKNICFGPLNRPPRMVWAVLDTPGSAVLARMKTALEDQLEAIGVRFRREHRDFLGHITLARRSVGGHLRTRPEERIRAIFTPKTIDLMESELRRTGAEYHLLQSAPFLL